MKSFPLQTIELCRSLIKVRGNEGIYRSIISRSYYAALIFAALWIEENHQSVDWNRKRLHQFVPSKIGQWLPKPYNKQIPAVIHDLRDRRENADYQPLIIIKKIDAKRALEEAEYIISILQKL